MSRSPILDPNLKPTILEKVELVRIYRGSVRLPLRIFGEFNLMRPGESKALAPEIKGVRRFSLVHDDGRILKELGYYDVWVQAAIHGFTRLEDGELTLTMPDACNFLSNHYWRNVIELEDPDESRPLRPPPG